jgi:hypothetical protein
MTDSLHDTELDLTPLWNRVADLRAKAAEKAGFDLDEQGLKEFDECHPEFYAVWITLQETLNMIGNHSFVSHTPEHIQHDLFFNVRDCLNQAERKPITPYPYDEMEEVFGGVYQIRTMTPEQIAQHNARLAEQEQG